MVRPGHKTGVIRAANRVAMLPVISKWLASIILVLSSAQPLNRIEQAKQLPSWGIRLNPLAIIPAGLDGSLRALIHGGRAVGS